ncbi:hypothetical protein [Streptomyces sp. LMG1-1-1.1]|uniref:hypothetical protein n=1 Tax=Streptomyces sp. LMG1-1-1.1 TaxID=3135245 RepID=UPI0034672B3B
MPASNRPACAASRTAAEHAPVALTAHGAHRGRSFDWTRAHTNNCEAIVKTGPFFSV